jgi:beta-galactosidase
VIALTTTGSRARLDLSGPWELAFDSYGEGIRNGWMSGNWPEAGSDRVQIPAIWDVTHPDAEGVGFYRKLFVVPPDWQGRVLRLCFGGASYRAEIWLNGVYVGSHEGAYTPFRFDVTSLIEAGSENQLVVRVAGLSKVRDVDGMALRESPASKQTWYYTHGGLWGEVCLEALPMLSCQAVFVEPDPAWEAVSVEVVVGNSYVESRPVNLEMQILKPDGGLAVHERFRITVPPGTPHLTYRIALPRPMLWSCESPNLYQLRVRLREQGEEADVQTIPFGMREFTVENGQFLLNGEPIILRGLLLQPNYPVTLVVTPTREMMVREITLAKEAGFNLIRAHIRPAPPGYLDLTDRMGMLVYAESSLAWIKDSPRLLDHARRELGEMIARDRNHPSVVFWGIHNENRAASALTSEALIRFVRALDPTRVVVDNSGGTMAIDQDFGWADRTTVVPSRGTERQRIQDLHIYVGAPIPSPVYDWLRTLGISHSPVHMSAHDFGSKPMLEEWNRELRTYRGKIFVSELGCGGMADLDKLVAGYQGQGHLRDAQEMKAFRDSLHEGFEARRLDRVFGSVHNLIQASQALQAAGLARQIKALMTNPRVSGYIITQLNDVAWESHAGILDPWRNPKPVYYALKRLNQPHSIVLKAATFVTACGEQVDVELTLVNRQPLSGKGHLHMAVYDPAGNEIETWSQAAPPSSGIRELGTISIQTGQISGEYRVSVRLIEGPEALAESSETILALPRVDLAEVSAAVESWAVTPTLDTTGDQARVLLVTEPGSLSEGDWGDLLDTVHAGRVAIIGPLHKRDGIALRSLGERGIDIQLHYGIGNWMGCYHWVPKSDLFAGLPAGGLAREAYVDVLPWYVISEMGGEILAGSLRNTQTRREPPAILWYSDIEVIHLGEGTMLFCQYRIFRRVNTNPLAAKLTHNLIRLAESYLG